MFTPKLATLLLSAAFSLGASAQSVHVLEIPLPGDYQVRHQSDDTDLTVSYTGKVPAGQRIYVRIFMDTQANLIRQAANLKPNQCVSYAAGSFWRPQVKLSDGGFGVDIVMRIFRSSTPTDRDFTLVFETGDELGPNSDLKLDKKGVADYFRYSIPMHVYASPADQTQMAERARAATPTVFDRVARRFDHAVPTVSAHPVTSIPTQEPVRPAIAVVTGPCRSVTAAALHGTPAQTQALQANPNDLDPVTTLPVLDLTPHPCGS